MRPSQCDHTDLFFCFLQSHLEIASAMLTTGVEPASVVGWPSNKKGSIASMSDVILDAPSMSATLPMMLGQVVLNRLQWEAGCGLALQLRTSDCMRYGR